MIHNNWEYIVSVVLILAGIFLYNYSTKEVEADEEIIYGSYEVVPIDTEKLYSILDKRNRADKKINVNSKVLVLFFIRADMCHPCLNNVLEYQKLINSNYQDLEMVTVFTESDIEKIRQFIQIVDYNTSYITLSDVIGEIKLPIIEQSIAFIDIANDELIMNTKIPGNVTTSVDYKKGVIEKAIDLTQKISEG